VVRYIPFSKKKHSWCRTVTLGPGIHWHWPKTTEIEVIPVERQTLDLPVQTLWTSDLRDISVRAEVVFSIDDVRLAICRTFDFQQTIQDVAQLAVVEVVATKSSEELGGTMRNAQLIQELTDKLQCKLKSYGVRVERAFLAEFTSSTAMRVYGEQVAGTVPLLDQIEHTH
jgi:regulator of protease activity HflC (stomatin/prohibitin superfamily)